MPEENEQPKERKPLDERAKKRMVNNYRQDADGLPAKNSFSL